MPVEILKEGAEYAAWDEEILEIGYGSSPEEARADLVRSTRDMHREFLLLGPDRLGPHLMKVLEILNERAMMAEDTKQTLDRLAKVIRSEASDLEARHREQHGGSLRDSRPADQDWQRGRIDGLREASDLLDEGKGK